MEGRIAVNVIETRKLHKQFGQHEAVKDLSLRIPEGEVCGFLGPNGSGKTTTIRMLLGLAKPTSGQVMLFDMPLKDHKSEILSQVGALVDAPAYYEHLSAQENLEIMRLIHQTENDKIKEVLKIVELENAKHKKVRDFSLGMKQRLGIAIALMNNPRLIILDEPTNGLDPSGIKKIRELLIKLVKNNGISIIVSSHNLFEIEQMCSYVCLINEGELIYQGDIQTLLNKYRQDDVYFKTDKNEQLQSLLSQYPVSLEKERVKVQTKWEDIPNINKHLVEQGVKVFEIKYDEATLEDIFLNMTNKESSVHDG